MSEKIMTRSECEQIQEDIKTHLDGFSNKLIDEMCDTVVRVFHIQNGDDEQKTQEGYCEKCEVHFAAHNDDGSCVEDNESITSHTPGEWIAARGDVFHPDRTWGVVKLLSREACFEIDGDYSCFGHRTEIIAEVCDGEADKADAHLLAAAPKLLKACEYTIEKLRIVNGIAFPIMPILDAIAKART